MVGKAGKFPTAGEQLGSELKMSLWARVDAERTAAAIAITGRRSFMVELP
jgi:hypothetical protein